MSVLSNTYKDGMNKDLSPLKYSNTMYYDMLNFKVLTDKGSSFGSIVNERGNKLDFRIPSLPATYKLNLDYTGINFPTLNINGQIYK